MEREKQENQASEKEQINKVTCEQLEKELWLAIRYDLRDNLGVYTFMLTIGAFVLSGLFYFYRLGYFHALKIHTCYLMLEKEISLYNVIGLISITSIWVVLNYIMYKLIKNKKLISYILIPIIEMVVFWGVVLVLSNVELNDVMEIIGNKDDIKICVIISALCVLCLNVYGIGYGILFRISKGIEKLKVKLKNCKKIIRLCKKNRVNKKKIAEKQENKNINDDINKKALNNLLWQVFMIILATVLFGIGGYILGRINGNSKNDFKILLENKTQYYAVLYETSEEYIVAALSINDSGLVITETGKQMVISKQNIPTTYCGNIQTLKDDVKKTMITEETK